MTVQSKNGLGVVPPASSLIATGLTTTAAISSVTGATAGLLAAVGIGAQAVPIVGTIVGGIALVISALGLGNGCGETCTASTSIVNQIEPYMQQNLAAAQAQASVNGGCLTSAEVSVLTSNWSQLWNEVVTNCQKVGGPGGSQCIADRSPGGKYNWTAYYLTPIQQMPICSTSNVTVDASEIASGLGLSSTQLIAGAAILVGLFFILD